MTFDRGQVLKRHLIVLISAIVLIICGNAAVFADSAELTEADLSHILEEIPEYSGKPSVDVHDDVPYFTEAVTTAFDGYGPLDSLGRATVAFACVGAETMPKSSRENISEIHPSGWSDARYEGIEDERLYNRCHMIGFQLTGQNANERNLITGTRYMNVEGMLPFENSVADYINTTGNHVMYRVTPVFKGDELVCRGVLMEARSVEDPSVQFCAFCYNVQPGIDIDYTTGESSGDGRLDTGDAQLPLTRAVPEETSVDYILNTNTKKFHYPGCSSVSDMKEKNKKEYSGSREDLIAQGYEPCGRCNP